MFHLPRVAILVWLFSCPGPMVHTATSDPELTSRLVEDLRENDRRTASHRVRGRLTEHWDLPKARDQESTSERSVRFETSQERVLLEEDFADADTAQIYVKNEDLYFSVHVTRSGEYFLDRLGGQETNVFTKLTMYGDVLVHWRPLGGFTEYSLGELMGSPRFQAKSVAKLVTGGEELVRVEFTLAPEGENWGVQGWFTVDPARRCALRELRCRYLKKPGDKRPGDMTIHSRVTYGPAASEEAVAVPREVKVVRSYEPDGSSLTRTFVVDEFSLTTTSPERFDLAAFGLGDLAAPSGPRTPAVFWFLLIGVVALGASILMRVLARRHAPGLRGSSTG